MDELILIPLGTVAPYPKDGKNCPGFLIKYDNQNILLDCGNGCTRLMNLEKDLKNLKIFISHLHPDHFGDLISLLQAIYVYRKFGLIDTNIELYIPDKDIEIESFGYEGEDGWWTSKEFQKKSLEYRYIEKYAKEALVTLKGYAEETFKFDKTTIKTSYVPHPIHTYAIRINTEYGDITYSADTGTNNRLNLFAKNSDIFICESTFLKGQFRATDTHLYAHEAAQIASKAEVEKLLLTHFWPEIDKQKYVDEAKKIFPNTEAAIEGKQLILRRK